MSSPEDAGPPTGVYWRHVGLAALAGVFATLAALRSPILGTMPPIVVPYVPLDLRFVVLPATFALAQAIAPQMGWPGRATVTLGLAVFSAIAAHIHASAALAFAGVGWAEPGTRIGLVGLGASLASVLAALAITLETGRDRLASQLADRGLPVEEIDQARGHGSALVSEALATAAVAVAVLALGLRIADQFVGGGSLPLPEIFALAVVLGLGAVLLGVRGREDLPNR